MSEVQTGNGTSENGDPEKKRRIACDYPGCDKSFLRSEHLSRHQLNHYGRTLECDQCGKKFARSDLLHRHLDRHRHQQQKIHSANANSSPHHSSQGLKNLSSPYVGHPRPIRSLSADEIPRSFIRDPSNLVSSSHHYLQSQHVHPILPAPSHGPTGMQLQPCISPMQSMVPGISLPHEYGLPQPMFTNDVHHASNNNSPMSASIVIPASPNSAAVYDMNAKWDHLFQGGGIFEMSSIFGVEYEYGNLTPPPISLENLSSNISPYQSLIGAAPTPSLGEFTISAMNMEKIRQELPEYYRQQRYLASANSLAILLEKAFFHLNNNYPIFHRPTMHIENFPTYLTLAIASFGALLSDDQETQQFGLALHNYVRDFIFSPIMFSGNREIWVLQTMLLINITGNHLGKRLDHEMSDILHGTMVSLARRNSVIFDQSATVEGRREPTTDDMKWRDWIRRESIKRFAHFIFINDTQHCCIYGHQGVMSVWEMWLPMPCSDALWLATNPQEWRRIMAEERKARPQGHPPTLLDIVTAFVSPNSEVPINGVATDARTVPLDGLGLYAVVHGIFSVAWHYKHRKVPHYWANMMPNKIEDQQETEEDTRWLLTALHAWKSRYNMFWASAHYPMGYQPPSGMWSPPFRIAAGAIYDLACIWVQAPINDIQIAAGSRFAHGRAASGHRAQLSWTRVNKKTLSDDVCHHALNLVEAELLYKNESTGQPGLHSYLTDPSYPLFMPFVAYLGGLALWAYAHNLERQTGHNIQQRPMVSNEQGSFHVDQYGMAEYPRVNSSVSSSTQHFSETDDYSEIIRTLRGNLLLSLGNVDTISTTPGGASSFYSKSPPNASGGFTGQLGDNGMARLSLFKQGIDILLSHLKEQLVGHRWEIAMESYEILQGTTDRGDTYQ